jgi:hypothetical protein
MIHQVDDDRIARKRVLRRAPRVLCRYLIKKVEQHSAYDEADLVVGENVEEGNDLVDVLFDPLPRLSLLNSVLGGVFPNGLGDRLIGEKGLSDKWLLR